jgi:hypothetical protein
MRTVWVIAGVMAIMTVSSFASVSAASPITSPRNSIVADLEGRPIKPASISSFYCHDFDYPRVHCFRTAAALAEGEQAIPSSSTARAAFGAGDYVTIFDGASYSGAAMDLSQSYDALFSIGWNDRISAYKARNSVSGTFYKDWFASGGLSNFCCNVNVPSLPSDLDNAFSSVYRH